MAGRLAEAGVCPEVEGAPRVRLWEPGTEGQREDSFCVDMMLYRARELRLHDRGLHAVSDDFFGEGGERGVDVDFEGLGGD